MDAVLLILVLVVCLLLSLVLLRLKRDAPDRAELSALRVRAEAVGGLEAETRLLREENSRLEREKAALEARHEAEKAASRERLAQMEASEQRLKLEFENLASRIMEEKGRALQERGESQLKGLLTPLREQLQEFRQRVDAVSREDAERSASLLEQVRALQERSGQLSDQANQLAQAIRGNAKTQGDWGELIVERILEASGLQKGVEYEAQVSQRLEDGTLLRPDFLVHLPDGKVVILDSKVSLTAFERWSSSEDEHVRKTALQEHLLSVRKHVQELRGKDYSQLQGNRSLDFVVMVIPLEPAYQLALQADRELVYDLAASNVVITGPANLLITLKLIAQTWRREKENQNAAAIAEKAGNLYDHVLRIAESMDRASQQLGTAMKSVEEARKRLTDGKGNAINRINELKRLGAKVSKPLPQALEAAAEDDPEDEDLAGSGSSGE